MATMPTAMPMEAMHIVMPIAAISNYLQLQLLIAVITHSGSQIQQQLLIAAIAACIIFTIYIHIHMYNGLHLS